MVLRTEIIQNKVKKWNGRKNERIRRQKQTIEKESRRKELKQVMVTRRSFSSRSGSRILMKCFKLLNCI
jgi:hypothetical protein